LSGSDRRRTVSRDLETGLGPEVRVSRSDGDGVMSRGLRAEDTERIEFETLRSWRMPSLGAREIGRGAIAGGGL